MIPVSTPARKVYGVEELTRQIKRLLEDGVGWVWLEGELSNVSRPASGHVYFTLKDAQAQIRGALFRGRRRTTDPELKDGLKVRVYGQVTVYEKSGQYQIIAQTVEAAGAGDLQAAFEALKKKLEGEGLFDPSRKTPLPLLPQRIGMVTSPTGAAIRDMLNVLTRRFPNLQIVLSPVRVQGQGAAEEVAAAIDGFNAWGGVDVVIVGRGGGSLEDLWAFNEEVVARAIARSRLPVISAVGHEVDFTISDFVADLRAPTPSAAAELVIGRKTDFEARLSETGRRLGRALNTARLELKNRFLACQQSGVFHEPRHLLKSHRQRIEGWQRDLVYALRGAVRERQQRMDEAGLHARHAIDAYRQQLRNRFEHGQSHLRLLNPRAVLARGYSITRLKEGPIVRSTAQTAKGDHLVTLLADGQVQSTVDQLQTEKDHA